MTENPAGVERNPSKPSLHAPEDGPPTHRNEGSQEAFRQIVNNLSPHFAPDVGEAELRFRREIDFQEICWVLTEMIEHSALDYTGIEVQIEEQLRLVKKAAKALRRLEVDRFCYGVGSGHRDLDRALELVERAREDVERHLNCLAGNGSTAMEMFVANDLFRACQIIRRPFMLEKRVKAGRALLEEGPSPAEETEERRPSRTSVRRMEKEGAADFLAEILEKSGLPAPLVRTPESILEGIQRVLKG